MTNIISIGMIIYGVAAIVYSQYTGMTVSNSWWAQNSALVGGGVLLLLKNNLSAFVSRVKSLTIKVPVSQAVTEPAPYTPKKYEEKDLECLLHIKNRLILAGEHEALKLWQELAVVVLSTDIEKKEKVDGETVI